MGLHGTKNTKGDETAQEEPAEFEVKESPNSSPAAKQ